MTAEGTLVADTPGDETVPVLQFPTSYPRSAETTGLDQRHLHYRVDDLPDADPAALRAAFAVLLHRYSGQDDLLLAVAEETGPVALRVRIDAGTGFADLCSQPWHRTRGRSPVAWVHGEHPLPEGTELALRVRTGGPAGTELTLHYDGALFSPEFIARLAENHRTLLADALARPAAAVGELTVLSEAERRYLLETVNDTRWPFQSDAPVHSLVEAQARQTPDAPAVECAGRRISYRELDERANALARALLAAGPAPGARIGVSLARSEWLVCLLLAIHKAGCAYVPLDPAYPADRLAAIADSAEMSAVVFDGAEPAWLTGLDLAALPMDTLRDKASAESGSPLGLTVEAAAVAHLIYTSGSTGRPKGVVVHHRNVVALLAWAWETYQVEDVARVLFGTSLNFDLSVFELWCPLTMGGCVVVVDNVLALTERADLEPTLINTVPSALNVLVRRDALPGSTVVLNVAGEPLPRELVNAAFAGSPVRRLYNLYGPSEDTTYSTYSCFHGPVQDNPVIGVPIHNTRAYLLDGQGRLVPHGVPGELYLGGEGLSSGYINDPERTAEVFTDSPREIRPRGPLYRTGDLACWTESGELFFLGRKDSQVKIRGYRIELGEIESVLREIDGLREVAALAVPGEDDTRLVCYLGLEGTGAGTEQAGEHLRRRLPLYMQPALILGEPRLPLLPNGKVDRKTLAARPVRWHDSGGAPAELDADEAGIAAVWTDLLGLTGIGPDLDFFSVGGHSLLANLLAARLSERRGVAVRVSEVYEHRTVAAQARLLRGRDAGPEAGPGADTEARFAAVRDCLHQSVRGHGVPGAGVAVLLDGQTRYFHVGLDDEEQQRPRGELSRQRVTCVTKALIAYVALMLVDRGLLGLDQPLGEVLPEATQRRGRVVPVTLRQLLSHTSGIDDSYEVWHDTDLPDLDSYVAGFADYGQLFEPGEIYAYSACGTSTVALLIERLLGLPWRQAVNELLLRPLGITEIAPALPAGDHYGDSVATGYLWNDRQRCYTRFEPGPQTVANDATDSFSVCFTVEEVLRLATFALDDGVTEDGRRLLSAELAEQMRSPQADIPGHHFMHSWGLGWLLFDPGVFGFNSNGSGHHNFIQVFAEQRMVLVLLANAYPTFGLYEDLVRSLTGHGFIRSRGTADIDLDACVGEYDSDGYRMLVTRGPEHLHYEYFERARDGGWTSRDDGALVLSGTGGFSSISDKNVLAGSISFIFSTDPDSPSFVRLGQRVARRKR